MKKAIFLDRDGTLNVDDKGYTHKIKDYKLHDGVIEGLRRLKDYSLFIITNQSGIGRGHYTEEDMHSFNEHLLKDLAENDIQIEKVYFCPHVPGAKCDCRKPNSKFILEAREEFGLDLAQSWVIGDSDLDIGLAQQNGCKSVYLLTGHGIKHLEEARKFNPNYVAADFLQAADFINFMNENKIIDRGDLLNLCEFLRKSEKKIVTINGTFDVLHKGHEEILSEAKKQGDVLIVGVNSDSSVKFNKGPERPINDEISRVKMIAVFDFVDYATVFNERTPVKMLEIIKPQVHVNGSEYGKECVEKEVVEKNGGIIHIIKLLEGYSTTKIIRKNIN